MNVCILSMDFIPNIGGISAHVYELSFALIKKGLNVIVINIEFGDIKESEFHIENLNGIIIHRILSPNIFPISKSALISVSLHTFKNSFGKFFLKLLCPSARKIIEYIDNIVTREKVDIIHCHTLGDALLCKFMNSNVPKIFTNHSSFFIQTIQKLKVMKKIYYATILNHIDAIIAPSKELAYKSAIFTKNRNIFYIPNGVNTAKFRPYINYGNLKEHLGISREDNIVICPRRLVKKNGVEYFITSIPYILEKVNNTKFIIIGDGPQKKYIINLIKKLNIEKYVILTGNVSNNKMPLFYSIANVVVIPSLIEATSIAGLESMACGKPIVGSNVGGLPEIIEDKKTGFLVKPKSSKDIAQSVIKLLTKKKLQEKMGEASVEKIFREFDWNVIAQKTLVVYNRIKSMYQK